MAGWQAGSGRAFEALFAAPSQFVRATVCYTILYYAMLYTMIYYTILLHYMLYYILYYYITCQAQGYERTGFDGRLVLRFGKRIYMI